MINLFKVSMPKAIDKPLLETLHSGYIGEGPKVKEFEEKMGEFLGTPNVAAVNSGTSALQLALRLAGVKPGDEVIATPMTCSATNLPVLALGARIVWADIDPETGNISGKSIEEKITDRTKAILFVDWGGTPADLADIMSIARAHDLKVIEDAAHALGAEFLGQKVGTISDFTCFSLQAIKHITTGDGGLLVCKDPEDYKQAKILRWYGIDREAPAKDTRIDQDIEDYGYKFHMNDIAATIGLAQLPELPRILEAHRHNAKQYDEHLDWDYFSRVRGSEGDRISSYWLYTIKLPDEHHRALFKEHMEKQGIMVSQVHRRNDDYSVFHDASHEHNGHAAWRRDYPGLKDFANRMICIPVHWGLSSDDLHKILHACNQFAKDHKS